MYSCLEFQRVLTRSKSSSFSQQPVKSTKFALRIHLSSFTESSCTSSTFLISLRLLFRKAGGAEGETLTIKKNSKLRAPHNHLAWWTLNPLHPNIDQYPNSPHSRLYISFGTDKENLLNNRGLICDLNVSPRGDIANQMLITFRGWWVKEGYQRQNWRRHPQCSPEAMVSSNVTGYSYLQEFFFIYGWPIKTPYQRTLHQASKLLWIKKGKKQHSVPCHFKLLVTSWL